MVYVFFLLWLLGLITPVGVEPTHEQFLRLPPLPIGLRGQIRPVGFEPTTSRFQSEHSTIELRPGTYALITAKGFSSSTILTNSFWFSITS